MGHEIYSTDLTLYRGEPPWHGLGTVIDYNITFEEGYIKKLLPHFEITLVPAITEVSDMKMEIPRAWAVVRSDDSGSFPIGIVGERYEPFQNSEFWRFCDRVVEKFQGVFETGGSLRMGRVVWGLGKTGEIEYLSGDPIQKYVLITTSHDGTQALRIVFTNVRVVCNNTLTLALKEARSQFFVRHTRGSIPQITTQLEQAIYAEAQYQKNLTESMQLLAQKALPPAKVDEAIKLIFRPPEKETDETSKRARTIYENTKLKILELVETGQGADLPGVRGTAYGLFQAISEYADHYRSYRQTERTPKRENKFLACMFPEGGAAGMKSRAINVLRTI